MAKHKIVKFENGIAKIKVVPDFTEYLPLEDNKTLFINPDLKYVRGVSPEFWTVKDDMLWPMEGEELERRRKILTVQTAIPGKSDETIIDELLIQIESYRSELLREIEYNKNIIHVESDVRKNEVDELYSKIIEMEDRFKTLVIDQRRKYVKVNVILTIASMIAAGLIYLIK